MKGRVRFTILGAIFVAAFYVTYISLDETLFSIPGVRWDMPIPVIYWALGGLWAYIGTFEREKTFRESFSGIVKPWLLTQAAILLVDLKARLRAENPLNKIYYLYILLVALFFFCLLAYLASRFLRGCLLERRPGKDHRLIYPFAFLSLMILLLKDRFRADLAAVLFAFVASFFFDGRVILDRLRALVRLIASNRTVFLVLLYVLALAARIAFSHILIGQVGDRFPSASCDGGGYDSNAVLIAKDFRCLFNGSLNFIFFGPYYWIFLALLYRLFGHSYYVSAYAQSVIASFLAPLVYLIARRLTGDERISKMSGLLTAFCMSLIYISVVLEPESLMIPCLWLFLLLVTRYGEGGRVPAGLPLLAGGTFGLMNGTRSVMSLFIVCVAAWLFAFVRTMNVRTKLAHALVLVLATVALTAPAQLMCSSRKDDLTKSGSSFVLSPAASTYHCDNSELARMGFNPFSSIPKSFEIFVNDPVRVGYLFLKAAASNTHRFFFLNFFGYFNPFILVVPSKYYNPFGAYMLFYMYAFMLAGGYLLLFSRRVKREMAHLLLFLFIYYVVTHPVFFVMMNARYRTPLHPLFIILFSMGFYHVRDRLKAGGAA